jgi:hypothetical protein
MNVRELLACWRDEAAILRKRGAYPQADAVQVCADELEGALASEQAEELSIAAAAQETGYSPSQLRRLFPGQRAIRRVDLPRKGTRSPKGAVAELVGRLKAS